MPTIDLPQGALRYRTAGPEGSAEPPVVFVHPVLFDGRLWAPVADRLARRGIRSYAPDWPLGSHTLPLAPDADRSPAGVAHMVRDFLTALDLVDVTLVGNDTGGALTQYVVASGEPRVGQVVLLNCDAFDTFPPFPFNLTLRPLRSTRVARLLAAAMSTRAVRHSWVGYGLLARDLPAELTRSWIMPLRTDPGVRRDLATFLRNIRPGELYDVTNRLRAATVPVTVVWGMRDKVFRPALGRRLAATIGTRMIEAPGARALLALDSPDVVVDAITTASRPGPGPRPASTGTPA